MKRLLKLLLWLVALLIITVLAVVVTVATVDPNEHKDWITDQFQDRTGRSLALDGDLDISFYPWLGMEVNDVTVGNAAGFGDSPFLHADYAKVRVKLLPLLHQQYEVDTVQVHGLVLNLAVNKNGISNWADLLSPEPRQSEGLPLAAIALGGVDIKDAAVHLDNRATGARYDVTGINASTGQLVYGEPVQLALSLAARANQPELAADVNLSGTLNYDLGGQQYGVSPLQVKSVVHGPKIPGGETALNLSAAVQVDLVKETASITDLDLDALGTRASGMIQAGRIRSPTPTVQARLDVSGDDLSLPFRVLEIEPLASQLAGLQQRSFTLSTRLDADMRRGDVDVPEFKAQLLGADIEGQVKAGNIRSATPAARGSLTASGPDLPTLLQVLGQFQSGKDKTLAVYGRKLSRVPGKAFSIKAEFDADMKSGDINVPTLSADSLGMHLAGNLKARDMQSRNGSIQGKLSMNSDHPGPVLAALDKKDVGEVMQSMAFESGISGNRVDLNLRPMTLKFILAGKDIPNSPVDVVLNAATHVNLDKQQLDLDDFSLAGLGLDIKGQLHATDIQQAPKFRGQLKVAPFDLRKLMRQLNKEPPRTANKGALGKVAVDAAFNGGADKLDIGQLDLVLDKTNLKGDLSVINFKQPAVAAKLDLDQMNLDDYLPPKAADQPVTPEAAAGAAAGLPVKTLRALNANVDLKAGRLVVSNLKLADVVLHLQGKGGRITLNPVKASLYQGSYTGNIQLDATGKLPKLAVNSNLKGVQMRPLLDDLTGKPAQLYGTSNVNLDVSAAGRNSEAMKKALNGTLQLNVQDGVLVGVDVRKVLAQAEIILESKRLAKIDRGEKTEFENLSATLNIKSGIVDNNDLVITSPGFKVTGNGMVANLRNDSIKYDMQVSVERARTTRGEEAYNLGGYSIPIACRGRIQSPSCQPDYNGLLKAALKKAGEEKLKDILNKALGGGTTQQQGTTTQQKDTTRQKGTTTEQKQGSGQQTAPKQPEDALKDALQKGLQDIFK